MQIAIASEGEERGPLRTSEQLEAARLYGTKAAVLDFESQSRRESSFRDDPTPEQILFESGFNARRFPEQIPMYG
jgi:hypothetical protein